MKRKAIGFLQDNRAPLAVLAAGAVLFCLLRSIRARTAWVDAYLRCFSMPVKRVLSALVNPLPCSAAELLCLLAAVGVLALGADTLRRHRRGEHCLLHRLCGLAAAALWIWLGFYALWGTQYYGSTLSAEIGLADTPLTVEQLYAVTAYFARQVNSVADTVPRDENGLFAVSQKEIMADTAGLYDGIAAEYPALSGPERRPKGAWFSPVMSACGFTGYIFPLFGESTLNVDCPAVFLPVTIAHEFSHQRGVAPEQEANFCGIEACITSDKPVYRYSGWLYGYMHLSNALYKVDKAAALALADTILPGPTTDMLDNNAYWERWDSAVTDTMQSNYDNILRHHGQSLGMASYGACVDLLVAHYGGKAYIL